MRDGTTTEKEPIIKIANIEKEERESYRWGLMNSPYKRDVLLKRGIVYAIFKKPKRTLVGVFSNAEAADKCIDDLGRRKHYRRLYYIDTSIYQADDRTLY